MILRETKEGKNKLIGLIIRLLMHKNIFILVFLIFSCFYQKGLILLTHHNKTT